MEFSINIKRFLKGILTIGVGILVYLSVHLPYIGTLTSGLLILLGCIACIKSLGKYVKLETPRGFGDALAPKFANILFFVAFSVFVLVIGPIISPGNLSFCDGSVDLAKSILPVFYPFSIAFSSLGYDMRVCNVFMPILAVIHLPYWYFLSSGIMYLFHTPRNRRRTKNKNATVKIE